MGEKLSKSQKREQRQAEKVIAQQEKSVKFKETALPNKIKQIKIAEILSLGGKVVKTHEFPAQDKCVYISNQETLTLDCCLTWCTTHSDIDGNWSWNESRAWTDDEWLNDIKPNFNALERNTWQELLHEHKVPARGGKHVPKNHPQEIHTLVTEAQSRWLELGLDQYDTAFRFRFGGTVRAWGIKLHGHFYLVWWERHHKVYPV